ncbi:MAG: hypothetical protein QGD94_12150 [Planctomycetia bacterium]|nr:hypothetical protein [Planctomycetia bacterium]
MARTKWQAAFGIAVAFAFLAGCASENKFPGLSSVQLCRQISNSGISWSGNYFGLWLDIVGPAEQEVVRRGDECVDDLKAALMDEARFVAAHVLLTRIVHNEIVLSSSMWNGLKVDLLADGSTQIDPSQREALVKLWLAGGLFRPSEEP